MKAVVDWLRAQLYDDRATAQAVLADMEAGCIESPVTYPVCVHSGRVETVTHYPVYDPRERLRDIAVKLAMLDRWSTAELPAGIHEKVKTARQVEQDTLTGLILSLSTVYMTRPGYAEAREEWHRAMRQGE